jgi:hypothetical protein
MTENDHKLYNQICKTYMGCIDQVLRQMCRHVPPTLVKCSFEGAHDDAYVLFNNRIGYKLEIRMGQDAEIICEAKPGEFVETNKFGRMWVNHLTKLHNEMALDQRAAGLVQ